MTGSRGKRLEYLQFEKGYQPENDVFEGIDISWARVEGGSAIGTRIDDIIGSYNPINPSAIVSDLLNLRQSVLELEDDFWKEKKVKEIDDIIYAATGLFLEVKSSDYTACPGETLDLNIEAINRSDIEIVLKSVSFRKLGIGNNYGLALKNNTGHQLNTKIMLPTDMDYSQPYWLAQKHSLGMFNVSDQELIGKAVNGAAVEANFLIEINGQEISYTRPIIYKTTDPVVGEVYKPFYVIPPVFANISGDVNLFNNHKAQEITVYVRAGKNDVNGELKLQLPESWKVSPSSHTVNIQQKNSQQAITFKVTPPEKQEVAFATPVVEIDNQKYSYSYTEIDYEHIPFQILFEKSESKFVKLELERGNENIGYIMGAGDNIPENLRQIGYEVDVINELEFTPENLDQYETIILGIRSLNTVDRLQFDMPKLFDYVERGGNLVVQYNTSHRLVTQEIAPYPLQLSRDRITVEEARGHNN